MDIEAARRRCRQFAKMRMRAHNAEKALAREGFDAVTIDQAMSEYAEIRAACLRRQRRFTQLVAAAGFLICGGLFVFFAFFAYEDRYVFNYWLLAVAMFALLKALLP